VARGVAPAAFPVPPANFHALAPAARSGDIEADAVAFRCPVPITASPIEAVVVAGVLDLHSSNCERADSAGEHLGLVRDDSLVGLG
jgi:hypothetical protein